MLYKPLSLSLIWTARAALELFSKKNHGPEPNTWGVACRILADEGRINANLGFYMVARSCTDASNRRATIDPQLRQITADLHWVEEVHARTLGCPGWMVSSILEPVPKDLAALQDAFRRRYDDLIQEAHAQAGAQELAHLYTEDPDAYSRRYLLGAAQYREQLRNGE